jgi:hypothetical protein
MIVRSCICAATVVAVCTVATLGGEPTGGLALDQLVEPAAEDGRPANEWTLFPDSPEQADEAAYSLEAGTADDENMQHPHETLSSRVWQPTLLPVNDVAMRAGWWDVNSKGSPRKVGEWQSLRSAPFWDFDGLLTDGDRTVDFYGTGLDDESYKSGLRFYGPNAWLHADFIKFPHRLEYDPLMNLKDSQQQDPGGNFVIKRDLNPGEDYAIRVEELQVDFGGKLARNVKWRLNLWGIRRHGERQVNAVAHCYSDPNGTDVNGDPVFGRSCHVLSQSQRIDWLTMEIQPVVEATVGSTNIEYSRTMRSLSVDDELTTRPYDRFGFNGDFPYAVVPENYTEIDTLKFGVALRESWDLYARLYNGNTLNRNRDTNRRFSGLDLRTTDWSLDGITLSGFAKKHVQTGQLPDTPVPQENLSLVRPPINYDLTTAGIKGNWLPFDGEESWRGRLLFSSGYEYRGLARQNAVFTEETRTVDESQTTANWAFLRTALRSSSAWESYVRYRVGFTDDPLYGIAKNGITNSKLPTESHLVEIGGTWTPSDYFLVNGTFGIDNAWSTSSEAHFDEESYPIVLTTWYAPTQRLSFSGGLAFFSNWIDQDITLGALSDSVTLPWNFGGRSDVVNLGMTYAYTERLTLSGGFEFVRGVNAFGPPAPWPDLPYYSDVIAQITRWKAGIDYAVSPNVSWYFRYQLFDYDDRSRELSSGTTSMVLGGVSAVY